MADQEVTHTLIRLDGVTARQINQNFRDVTEFVNGQTVHRDGAGVAAALSAGLVWEDWTPTLTALTTNPTLGTGSTANGRFMRVGGLVVAEARIAFGTSGTAAGSGGYRVSLPVDAARATALGSGFLSDSSTGNIRVCSVVRAALNVSAARLLVTDAEVTNAAPWAWAASDTITVNFMYEAA